MKKYLSFLPALFWMGLIFYGSSMPGSNLPPLFPYADIVFHFFEYFILAALWCLALKKIFFWPLLIAALYAASDEFHQFFVPGRDASIFDFLVDFIGAAGGQVLAFLFFKQRLSAKHN